MISKSQLNQDINVVTHYKDKQNGYFIEIGASDGISLSNTYILEKNYGWTGICVEPIPTEFLKLQQNRSCLCYDYAIYSTSNLLLPFAVKNFSMCSGLVNTLDNELVINDVIYNRSVNHDLNQIINVKTISFSDLLIKSDAPKFIEYLSIDTEGSELEILSSIDFNTYKFGMIDIEHNFVEPRRSKIRELLEKNNYIYNKENQFDDNYIYKTDTL